MLVPANQNSKQNTLVKWIFLLLLSLLWWPEVILLSSSHCIYIVTIRGPILRLTSCYIKALYWSFVMINFKIPKYDSDKRLLFGIWRTSSKYWLGGLTTIGSAVTRCKSRTTCRQFYKSFRRLFRRLAPLTLLSSAPK